LKIKKYICLLLLPLFLFGDDASTPKAEEPEELFNSCVPGILVNAECLYWNLQEGSLDYALRMKNRAWGPTPSFAQGDFERATFDWDPGYRFSLGYYRAENFWEVLSEYTFIRFKGSNETSAPPSDQSRFLNGTFPQIFTGPMERATSHIHLGYKLFNLIACRVFHPPDNPHLRLRLKGGVTAAFLNQGWRVRYFDLTNNVTATQNSWRYWGIGLRVGTTFDWFWGNDFYATGSFSTALTLGHYHNHAKQTTTAAPLPGDNPSIPVRDARYKDYRMALTMQLSLGPSYQKSFEKWRMEIFAGYELTTWSNLHEIYRSTQSAPESAKETWQNTGLITMQGLTTRASFTF